MTITGAIVMFSMTWFLVFLCILPTRQVSQFSSGASVQPRNFPMRNRTMALIAHATVIVGEGREWKLRRDDMVSLGLQQRNYAGPA